MAYCVWADLQKAYVKAYVDALIDTDADASVADEDRGTEHINAAAAIIDGFNHSLTSEQKKRANVDIAFWRLIASTPPYSVPAGVQALKDYWLNDAGTGLLQTLGKARSVLLTDPTAQESGEDREYWNTGGDNYDDYGG